MSDRPAAEVVIDRQLVLRLLRQAPAFADAATARVSHAGSGWDCEVWRLGEEFAVRLPRRAISAPLIDVETRWLPTIASRLVGVGVPAPLYTGSPDSGFPWRWSIVPWFEGTSGMAVPRAARGGWVPALAEVLRALHEPAADDYPRHASRGGPLTARAHAFAERMVEARRIGSLSALEQEGLESVWRAGLTAKPFTGPPMSIHGDLHPANLVARGSELVAVIDFGDFTAGDPAYDLGVVWTSLDAAGRAAFRDELSYDEDTWARAKAWAVATALLFLAHSDDAPEDGVFGRDAVAELLGDPAGR